MDTESRNEKINHFWQWFATRVDSISQVEQSNAPILDSLLEAIQRIHPKLYFEISTDAVPCELIITAEGRHELFPLVDAIVALAPDIVGWSFVSLKPPLGFDFITEYEGVRIDPKLLWFLPLDHEFNQDGLGLRVGLPNLDDHDRVIAKAAVLLMLDSGLGERLAAERISHVDVVRLPENPERHGYIELLELPRFIQWKISNSEP